MAGDDGGAESRSDVSIELFNHLSDEGFGLVNDEGAPTWTNKRGSFSVLDLVFMHDSLISLEPDVFVNLEGRGRSDHAVLSLAFGTTKHWGRPYTGADHTSPVARKRKIGSFKIWLRLLSNEHLCFRITASIQSSQV